MALFTIDTNKEGWNDFGEVEPTEIGYYTIKDEYDRVFENIKWNGKDFVLQIGIPVTHEVWAWK
jgi:hypothetical protein